MQIVKKLENDKVEVIQSDKQTKIYVLNVKKNPTPPMLPLLKAPLNQKLVKMINLRSNMPPIYDQGNLGSCVSNATSACVSYVNWKRMKKYFNISRLYNYFTARSLLAVEENNPSYIIYDTGLYMHNGCQAIKQYGAIIETAYPYNINNFAKLPPGSVFINAAKKKQITYSYVNKNLVSIKTALTNKHPIMVGINVYENFFDNNTNTTGVIKMPNGQFLGGHALVIIGYNDDKKIFNIRNSWGTSWGDSGYGTIPYEYILSTDAYDLIIVTRYI